ncbi:hypothetical protein O7635_24895 [Asanoa sp. WMMD1127]|uniref:hypothetical protein n=1 Tax=Asanoa sp. WMMD1127 TaxID=3016107 RepID=UPI002416ABDF|nr:hypothetical protein [Asanoa sp. WMMD1127]MDG4825098.1 hypothetical protein [Asanoa sp. WMMD1127]
MTRLDARNRVDAIHIARRAGWLRAAVMAGQQRPQAMALLADGPWTSEYERAGAPAGHQYSRSRIAAPPPVCRRSNARPAGNVSGTDFKTTSVKIGA